MIVSLANTAIQSVMWELLTQNVMTSIRMYLCCSRTCRRNCIRAGGHVEACYTSDMLNGRRIPCAGA